MSLKDLFDKTTKVVNSQIAKEIYDEFESEEFLEKSSEDSGRYLPEVDFSTASNFARYGSAEKYYVDAIKNIYQRYPYDGSKKEKQEWRNKSTQIDLYVYDNIYPKTTGYINLQAVNLGIKTGVIDHRTSSVIQNVEVFGGPNSSLNGYSSIKDAFDSSNIYDISKNRESNLGITDKGNTVEFWFKDNVPSSSVSPSIFHSFYTLFDLWNGELSSSVNYTRLAINRLNKENSFYFDYRSGSSGISNYAIACDIPTPNQWHHYAFSFKNNSITTSSLDVSIYIDGQLKVTKTIPSVGKINLANNAKLKASIGARQADESGISSGYAGLGTPSGSFDEFRFWKEQRLSRDIGRYWFTNVDGGSNRDDSNTELGVYFKFNEGITGNSSIDAKVLDYSGRISNGTIKNYSSTSRNTGSAINSYSSDFSEVSDPIIYSSSPLVIDVLENTSKSGSLWDEYNNASIYNSIPSWIMEEQEESKSEELENLLQIMSSYFDTLHLQIENLPRIKDVNYYKESTKPNVFIDKILSSYNFENFEIFNDASLLETLLSRNETTEYDKKINDIKNAIYQNIYNNLVYIYKSKGTEKSIRNLLRCYGIDDELIKLNIYSNNSEYEIKNKYSYSVVNKKTLDFSNVDNNNGFIIQKTVSGDVGTSGFISGNLEGKLDFVPITVEAEIIFPKKLEYDDPNYVLEDFSTVSLFGAHTANNNESIYSWGNDEFNFAVTAQKRDNNSKDVYFKLSGSFKDSSLNVYPFSATSSYFTDVYENEKWNLAVRIKHYSYPSYNTSVGNNGTYIIELVGINTLTDYVQNKFAISASVPVQYGKNALSVNKRIFAGAHFTNYDKAQTNIAKTNIKLSSIRYWLDYVTDEELLAHAYDINNFGTAHPERNAHIQNSAINNIGVSKQSMLTLNWDFNQISSSNSSGELFVEDASSGSYEKVNNSYGWIGKIANYRHTGYGINFYPSDKTIANNEFFNNASQKNWETLDGSDLIQIRTGDDVNYTKETRPINYFYSLEKSMYQIIDTQILNWLGTINSFNNLIGEPLERYRKEYKSLERLRNLFFERVGNTPDFEKFLQFFKWIDNSILIMVSQLFPASAEVSSRFNNIIESHMLERNKYENRLPIISRRSDPVATFSSFNSYKYEDQRAQHGSVSAGLKWLRDRLQRNDTITLQDGSKIASGVVEVDTARETIRKVKTAKNLNSVPLSYDYKSGKPYEYASDFVRGFSKVNDLKVELLQNPVDSISPVKISNNKINSTFKFAFDEVTGSGQIYKKPKVLGNYLNTYEYFQTSGRTNNNKGLPEILSSLNITSSNSADRTLPVRPVIKTIFVERFSAPGGPEVNSRGALDAEAEEFSVYNSLNNRNLIVRRQYNRWLSESSSLDKENPSYHKINKNVGYKIDTNGSQSADYDNWFISHQIPRSDSQYLWITHSLTNKPKASGYIGTTFPNLEFYGSSSFYTASNLDFSGLNLTSSVIKDYDFSSNQMNVTVTNLNNYLLNMNGPYQGASWRQIRNQDNKFVYAFRKTNKVVTHETEPQTFYDIFGRPQKFIKRSTSVLKQHIEPPIEYNIPMNHDISMLGSEELIKAVSSYDNNKNKFANKNLSIALNTSAKTSEQFHDLILKAQNSDIIQKPLLKYIEYKEMVFPRKEKVGLKETRFKPNYDDLGSKQSVSNIRTYWKDDISNRARSTSSIDLFEMGNNSFSSVPDFKAYIYNRGGSEYNLNYTSSIVINSGSSARESIFSTDAKTSYSGSISSSMPSQYSYTINYNDYIRGNLYKNSLVEEKTNILNQIEYPVDNIILYDVENNNFYNISGNIEPLSIFNTSSLVVCSLSCSEGIYFAGDFVSSSVGSSITLWNGSKFSPLSTALSASMSGSTPKIFVKSMISCSDGLYAVGTFSGSVARWNGSSWKYITGSLFPADDFITYWGANTIVSSSSGIIVGGMTPNYLTTSQFRLWNGSSWSNIGTVGVNGATCHSIISGSDGLYAACIAGNETPLRKFTGSLSNPSVSTWQLLGSVQIYPAGSDSDFRILQFTGSGGGIISATYGYTILSASDGVYIGGDQWYGHIKRWNGATIQSVGTGIDNGISTLFSRSDGIYAGGGFQATNDGVDLNGMGRWDGTSWSYIGKSQKRSGASYNRFEGINSIINSDKYIIFSGYLRNHRNGPTLKDQKNIYPNLVEGYKSYKDILIPHPQLTFNNFIPPFSGSMKIFDVKYSNKTPLVTIFTKSNGTYIINDGYTYEVNTLSNKKPFFNSYEEYFEGLKQTSQKYSIIPEFTISDYIKDYIKKPNTFNSIVTPNYLKIDGGLFQNNTNILNFNIISDNNLKYDQNEVSVKHLKLKVSGLKKFLPKKDFYPSERVTTLSKYFINSFILKNADITSSININDQFQYILSNNTPIQGQILTLLQPLFAPGILLNTIKSSIAVDWPVFITSSVLYDGVIPPAFYSSSNSELITNSAFDPASWGTLFYKYKPVNYLEQDPNFRLPFESLIEFDSIIPDNLKQDENNLYYLNPTHYTSDILTGSDYDSLSYPSYNMGSGSLKKFKFLDSNYQLAMHNFLAEVPSFFLKNGLNKFVSNKTKVYAQKGITYKMDVVLEKDSGYKSFIADPYYENLKTINNNFSNGTLLLPSVDSLYGPPSRYWNTINSATATSLFSKSPYNLYFKFIDTPAYAPYVPPYYYGDSIARISFTANDTREYSIKEIIEACSVEYKNIKAELLFRSRSKNLNNISDNYSSSPAYKNMMTINSSVNLFETTTKYIPTFKGNTYEVNTVSAGEMGDAWVIQTKFETPSINFADSQLDDNIGLKSLVTNNADGAYTYKFKGLWTTYGKPATQDTGITLRLAESPSGANVQSLANLCGFEISTPKQIGALGDNKVISEAVVIIPYTDVENHLKPNGTTAETVPYIRGENLKDFINTRDNNSLKPTSGYYFRIDRKIIKKVLGGLDFDAFSNTSYEDIKRRLYSDSVDENNSIIKLMRSMTKYVIPPHLNWLKNKSIDPFVMYIFEFKQTLDTEDLSDIWQGLMPKCSYNVEEDTVTIDHDLSKDEMFHGKNLPDDVRLKMFKVKQNANISYYDLTETNADDKKFVFKFGNSSQAQRPEYSYNWPYDFFSLVELVNVEAGISISKFKKG